MDTLKHYRAIIKTLLTGYYDRSISQHHAATQSEVSDRLALDEERDQYLWFRFGWDERKLVQHIIVYLCIKNGKVWVEQDATDLCVVDDLVAAGIPAQAIVLGFHHPQKRVLTEFATA
jgi:hypothetical protein